MDSVNKRNKLLFTRIHITTYLNNFMVRKSEIKTAHNINYTQFSFKSIFIIFHGQHIVIISA